MGAENSTSILLCGPVTEFLFILHTLDFEWADTFARATAASSALGRGYTIEELALQKKSEWIFQQISVVNAGFDCCVKLLLSEVYSSRTWREKRGPDAAMGS